MKAVILAAGKSTRTEPLTITRPKPLLKVGNKELIKHLLDELVGLVDEAVIVVGYKKEMIIDALGEEYSGIRIVCVEQKEQLGTAHAVLQAESFVGEDDFFLAVGDDMYKKEDFEKLRKHDYAILGQRVENPSRFGILELRDEDFLKRIVEKPKEHVSDFVNCSAFKLKPKVFDYFKNVKKSARGELEFTDVISELCKDYKVRVVETDSWMAVSYPWDLLKANERVLKEIRNDISGEIENGVMIKGRVSVGRNSVVMSGSYIEGPVIIGDNSKIGPNCYIRGSTSIGSNCHVGQGCDIKNSIIGDDSNIPHLSYVGDSVIGEGCNVGAGTVVANLRHDKENIKSMLRDELVDTGMKKLGTIIGDGVMTGVNTSILPGRKFWPNTSTRPGEVVEKDKTK
ncbi:NTP transferase domain-containing protein [Candidatus Woesearchaeota archaeon]|nr:NTP transferase domain-containing protein [Candidatus Woesearchaeota archaeon]